MLFLMVILRRMRQSRHSWVLWTILGLFILIAAFTFIWKSPHSKESTQFQNKTYKASLKKVSVLGWKRKSGYHSDDSVLLRGPIVNIAAQLMIAVDTLDYSTVYRNLRRYELRAVAKPGHSIDYDQLAQDFMQIGKLKVDTVRQVGTVVGIRLEDTVRQKKLPQPHAIVTARQLSEFLSRKLRTQVSLVGLHPQRKLYLPIALYQAKTEEAYRTILDSAGLRLYRREASGLVIREMVGNDEPESH